jgi:hypothetical protein
VDEVGTLKGWQLQPQNLCLQQCFEGEFWQEERLAKTVGVADSSADVGVGEELEGVHAVDGLDEDLREDELDARPADDGLSRLAVLALDHFDEELDVLGDECEEEDTLRLLVLDGLVGAVLCQLVLLGLQQVDDVLADGGQF